MSSRHWLHHLALGIALTLASPALGQGIECPQQGPGDCEKTNQPGAEQRSSETAIEPKNAVLDDTAPPTDSPTEDENKRQRPKEYGETDQPLGVAGPIFGWGDTYAQWAMAFAAVLAVIISGVAVELLRRTLVATRTMIAEAQKTTVAAKQAVSVARETLAETRITAERQLRAYISQDHPDWAGPTGFNVTANEPIAYRLKIMWRNFGATPARRCRVYITSIGIPGSIPDNFDYPEQDHSSSGAVAAHIGPAGHAGGYVDLRHDTLMLTARREMELIVWGWIEYNDAFFPITPRRRTEFCYKVEPIGDPRNVKPDLIVFGPHNGADEDCYRQPQT